jgi:hypothetical protein
VSSTRTEQYHSREPAGKFAVVVPVGPGQREAERVLDLIDSLEAFEAGNYDFILVDDQQGPSRFLNAIPDALQGRYTEIKNPRRGKGGGWAAGCAVAVLAGVSELIGRSVRFDFVLKLDTDALVIGPFSQKVAECFRQYPHVGMIGSIRDPNVLEPEGERMKPLAGAIDKLLKQVTVWRATPAGGLTVQVAFWGHYRTIRDTIRHAIMNGFRIGEHCYGGGYALSPECVRAFAQAGLLTDPRIWLPTPLVEDVIVSMCTKSVGFHLMDLSDANQPFAVRYRGLPATPEKLVEQAHSVIHSVKDFEDLKEAEIRNYFRQLRPNPCSSTAKAS